MNPIAPPPPGALYANCVPGLEHIVANEIAHRLTATRVLRVDRGRVFFTYPGDLRFALRLRTTDDLFACIGETDGVAPDESGLEHLSAWMESADLAPALAAHASIHGHSVPCPFRVTATRTGKHQWRSPQAAGWAGSGIVKQTALPVDLDHPDLDIWVEVTADRAVAGVRLSRDDMVQRSRVQHAIASLRPPTAHALCLMSDPQPGQIFLDPMCGAGTIPIERASVPEDSRARYDEGMEDGVSRTRIIAADKYALPIGQARANVHAAAPGIDLIRADAIAMPFPDATVDRIVSNLPWGRRIGSHKTDRWLFPRVLSEAARVLKPGGLAALLSLERRLLLGILEQMPALELIARTKLLITGMEPSVYIIRRL